MTTNYVPINSVMYDLSLTIDDRYWSEAKMLEWLHKGLRQIRSDQILESKLAIIPINNHKAQLPADLKYLTQVVYKLSSCDTCTLDELNLPPTSNLPALFFKSPATYGWHPLRLTTNPFHNSILFNCHKLLSCNECSQEFSVDSNLIITTTIKEGALLVSYLGYPKDEAGCTLIPDSEELKEALLHFLLYRYWMAKYSMMEDGADSRMKHHLSMWNTLSTKAAGNLNMPDVSEIENLHNQFNRLVPRTHHFQTMFTNLGSPTAW